MSMFAWSRPPAKPLAAGWALSRDGLSAIGWSHNSFPGSLVFRGRCFVVVRLADLNVVSCYASPNSSISDFLVFLDELESAVRLCGVRNNSDARGLLVGGDFNAKSPHWGCPLTNRRGAILWDWMSQHDMCLVNRGAASTCIRPQGSSIVELTWTSPTLMHRTNEWRIMDIETLSDHAYISFRVDSGTAFRMGAAGPLCGSRWPHRTVDVDTLRSSLEWVCTLERPVLGDANAWSRWINFRMIDAGDLAMRRQPASVKKRPVYWWND